ncbi:hypothetical protein [Shinella zoogloeoides]|uniref:hypothetical protein n=1 Tax=Shinella zoogloeoides TaxID=352475 RepID=UPI00273F4D15|nr:hypothetical protein [Shinella zoogloeoides]WLR90868.1 hypothetical protein Q9316_00395 [Shinella zoogloeoides]
MTDVPNFSPGCFGSALAFQPENPICRACPFNAQCHPLHETNLAALRERFGIKTTRRGPKLKPAIAPISDPAMMVLPVKVRRLLEKLDTSSLRITEKLAQGVNPFEGKLPFMQIACHLLLRLGRPLPRPLLAQAFVQKLGWQQNTADAHARMAFQALAHVGAITDSEAGAVLKRG